MGASGAGGGGRSAPPCTHLLSKVLLQGLVVRVGFVSSPFFFPQNHKLCEIKAQISPRDSPPAQPDEPPHFGGHTLPSPPLTPQKALALAPRRGEPSPDFRGKRTCLMKERTPLFSTFPGSQKAFFSFFFTSSLRSRRSIFESWRKRFLQPFSQPLAQARTRAGAAAPFSQAPA